MTVGPDDQDASDFRVPLTASGNFPGNEAGENYSLAALLTHLGAPDLCSAWVRWGRPLGRPGGPLHPHQQPFRTREAPVAIWGLSVQVVPEMHGSPQWPRAELGSRRRRAPGAPGRPRGAIALRRIVDLPGKSVRRAKTPEFESFSGTPGDYGESAPRHWSTAPSLVAYPGEAGFGPLSTKP